MDGKTMRILISVALCLSPLSGAKAQILAPILFGPPNSGGSTCGTPTFSPGSGIYGTTQSVAITSTGGGGCTICYTEDGTTPTASTPGSCSHGSTGTPASVASNLTLEAIGTQSGYTNSSVGSATYTIGTPTISFVNQSDARSTTAGGTLTMTLDGSSCTSSSQGCALVACIGGYYNDPTGGTVSLSGVTGGTVAKLSSGYGSTGNGWATLAWVYGITSMTSSASLSITAVTGSGGGYPQGVLSFFKGVATASPIDSGGPTGTTVGSNTQQPGSITPGSNGELGISCTSLVATAGTPTVSGSSYGSAFGEAADGTVGLSTAMSYVIQTTATAANPTWTYSGLTGPQQGGVLQQFFKP